MTCPNHMSKYIYGSYQDGTQGLDCLGSFLDDAFVLSVVVRFATHQMPRMFNHLSTHGQMKINEFNKIFSLYLTYCAAMT